MRKLLISLGALVSFGILLEVAGRLAGMPSNAVRTTSKITATPAQFGRTIGMWRPGFRGRVVWPPELAFDVSINSLGMRGEDVALERPPDRERVLCLGDSTTFCVYVDDGWAWPARLQALLRDDVPGVEVVNGGSPGFGPGSEREFFEDRAHRLDPTVVLHMFCINDLEDAAREQRGEGKYREQLARVDEGASLSQRLLTSTAIGEMFARLQLTLKVLGTERETLAAGPAEPPPEELWIAYEEAYSRLVAACRERGVTLVSTYFPDAAAVREDRLAEEQRFAAIAAKHGVPFIGTSAVFARAPVPDELFNLPVDLHASAQGNALLAETIARGLRERGVIPSSDR